MNMSFISKMNHDSCELMDGQTILISRSSPRKSGTGTMTIYFQSDEPDVKYFYKQAVKQICFTCSQFIFSAPTAVHHCLPCFLPLTEKFPPSVFAVKFFDKLCYTLSAILSKVL